jgi:hypothetical protein
MDVNCFAREKESKMRRMLMVFSLVLLAGVANASPYRVCDPHPMQADANLFFRVTGLPSGLDATHIAKEPAGAPYGFKFDIATITGVGPYTVRAKACIADPNWGERCSIDSAPLVFGVPVAPVSPAGAKLVP